MRGRWFKEMRKKYGPYPHEQMQEIQAEENFVKPVRLALKHAKKCLKAMKKGDPDSDCGLWYEDCRGYYRELCRCGGNCDPDSKICPYLFARGLVAALGGDYETCNEIVGIIKKLRD